MAFAQCEDTSGTAELIIFPKTYTQVAAWLGEYTVFVIKGELDLAPAGSCKIKVNKMIPFDILLQTGEGIDELIILLPATPAPTMLTEIKNALTPGKAKLALVLHENNKRVKIATRSSISFSPTLSTLLEQHALNLKIHV